MSDKFQTYRILVADDHDIVIDSYKSALDEFPEFEIAATASNGKQVQDYFQTDLADLVILDLNMPQMNGVQTIEYLKEHRPQVKIVVVSMITSPMLVKRVVDLGIDGYVYKTSNSNELINTIRTVLKGKRSFPDLPKFSNTSRSVSKFMINGKEVELTSREIQIIKLISQGKATPEIAEELFISPFTVQTHRKNIGAKLDTHNPADLITFAIRHNIISTI